MDNTAYSSGLELSQIVNDIMPAQGRQIETRQWPRKLRNIGAAALGAVMALSLSIRGSESGNVDRSVREVTIAAIDPALVELSDIPLIASVNGKGQEVAFNIAQISSGGAGSCSPYNRNMAERAAAGDTSIVRGDFLDVQTDFLDSNPEFNKNFTEGARKRVPLVFDALNLDSQATMADVTANPYYKQGTLLKSLKDARNTLCDEKGNVYEYMDTELEALNTGVAGVVIESVRQANGRTVVKFENGTEVTLTGKELIGDVELLDGTKVKMMVTNKVGLAVYVNGKKVFVGCDNILSKVPAEEVTTTKLPTTTTKAPATTTTVAPTTSSSTSTSSTSTSSTTITLPTTTTTTLPTTTTSSTTTSTTTPSTTTTVRPTTTTSSTTTTLPTTTTSSTSTTTTSPSTTIPKTPTSLPGPHPNPGSGGGPEQGMDPENDSDEDGYGPGDSRPADSDNDGFYDVSDNCPTEPETVNGFQDGDGCADTVPTTAVPTTVTPTTGSRPTSTTSTTPTQGTVPPNTGTRPTVPAN